MPAGFSTASALQCAVSSSWISRPMRDCGVRFLLQGSRRPLPESRNPYRVRLLGFKRSHVDRETILHIRLEQSIVSFIDFLHWDDLDISGEVMFTAKVEHLLGFGDAADGRSGETAAPHGQGKRHRGERLRG